MIETKRLDLVVPFGDEIIEIFFESVIGFEDLPFGVENFVEDGAEIGDVIGADDEIEMGEFAEEGVFFGHRHAAGDADEGISFLRPPHAAQLAHDFSLGQIADRAGIENQKIGRLFLFGAGVRPRFWSWPAMISVSSSFIWQP